MTPLPDTSAELAPEPCPFCGDNAIVGYVRDGHQVVCMCGASGAPAFHGPANRPSSRDRAITAWNTRTSIPDASQAELAETIARIIDPREFVWEMFDFPRDRHARERAIAKATTILAEIARTSIPKAAVMALAESLEREAKRRWCDPDEDAALNAGGLADAAKRLRALAEKG